MGTFSKFIVTFSLLCALAAGGAVAWLWMTGQQQQMQQQLAQQSTDNTLKDQRRQIAELVSQLSQLNSQDSARGVKLGKIGKSGAIMQGRVATLENQITELTGAHRVDWTLKEAEHFVIVAERRLSLLNDINGALALLGEADKLVKDMQEPTVRKLREALTQDLMALREASSKNVDSEGLFARIEILMTKVKELEKAALTFRSGEDALVAGQAVVATGVTTGVSETESGLSRFVTKLIGFAESMVRIRINDETTIKPMLLADQQVYLRQNIYVLLEQAQLSLLRTDYIGFKLSLQQASKRITQYLRTDTDEAVFVLAELDTLANTPMNLAIPSIEGSVRALQVFREYWQQEKVERQLQKVQLKTLAPEIQKAQ